MYSSVQPTFQKEFRITLVSDDMKNRASVYYIGSPESVDMKTNKPESEALKLSSNTTSFIQLAAMSTMDFQYFDVTILEGGGADIKLGVE